MAVRNDDAKQHKNARQIPAAAARSTKKNEEKILFYIPVTRSWLMQVIMGLIFLCKGSFRGVSEFLRDILDVQRSLSKKQP
ncbi:MAG: hypothetical protein GY862_06225 [Gammaproteobacteria bacterium]|nr:hypothetical protein [Gammaproteobacteria bacterium]